MKKRGSSFVICNIFSSFPPLIRVRNLKSKHFLVPRASSPFFLPDIPSPLGCQINLTPTIPTREFPFRGLIFLESFCTLTSVSPKIRSSLYPVLLFFPEQSVVCNIDRVKKTKRDMDNFTTSHQTPFDGPFHRMTERERSTNTQRLCKMCQSLVFAGAQSEDEEEEGSGMCAVLSTAFLLGRSRLSGGRKQPLKCWTGEASKPLSTT